MALRAQRRPAPLPSPSLQHQRTQWTAASKLVRTTRAFFISVLPIRHGRHAAALLPAPPHDTAWGRLFGGRRECERNQRVTNWRVAREGGEGGVGLGVPDERARTAAAVQRNFTAAFHFVLRSFKRPWHHPPCTPRAFLRDAHVSRNPAAAPPRRQKPGAPRSPPWKSCTSRTQILARQWHAQAHAPLGGHGRCCVGVHKQVESAFPQE